MVRGLVYSIPASAIEALSEDPEVDYISPERPVHTAAPAVAAAVAHQYGWNGSGIGVSVIDSGVSNHPDLKELERRVASRLQTGLRWRRHGRPLRTRKACCRHHRRERVSSSPGAIPAIFSGIAPAANLVNLRVLDHNGKHHRDCDRGHSAGHRSSTEIQHSAA